MPCLYLHCKLGGLRFWGSLPFYDWGGLGLFNFSGTQRGELPRERSATNPRPRVHAAWPLRPGILPTAAGSVRVRKSKRKRTEKPHKLYIFISPSVSAGSFPLISTGKRCAISAAVGSSAACLPTFKSIFCAACV